MEKNIKILVDLFYWVRGEYFEEISIRKKKQNDTKLNFNLQVYRTIPIRLIDRYYGNKNAMRYTINETNQNVWIPKKHLYTDGTIKENEDIDYVFRKAKNQLNIAGITWVIPRIKRKFVCLGDDRE